MKTCDPLHEWRIIMKIKKMLSAATSLALSLSAFAGAGTILPERALTASAASANWKFDFGSGGVSSGFTGVSASDGYNASRGYGFAQTWNVGNVSAGGSGAGSDAVEFKSDDAANTFNVDLPNGLYEVKVTVGNAPRCSIKMEGMLQIMNLTRLNATETIKLPVTDGQLNIQAVTGIKNGQRSISAIEITQINTTGEMPPMVWICGDSTVANYYNQADTAQHGWGQYFGQYAAKGGYEVRNMATSGQYAKGFVSGGQFDAIEKYGKTGDVYIISIGINDTNYSNKDEYREVVTDMTQRAKKKGMEVILVKQQGRHGDYNRNPRLGGRWFGGELDTVGSQENVKVVDLFTAWQDFGFSIGGYDAMTEYYAADDDLHQSKKGSLKIAELMSGLVDLSSSSAAEMNEDVYYAFKNVNSGLYMEVSEGKAESGANVDQWGSDSPAEYNAWKLKSAGDGYYYITSALDSSLVLDVSGNKATNGQNVGIYSFGGGDNQQFSFKRNTDGSYNILTKCSGGKSAVEVTNALTTAGANVQQWEVNGHDCQKWTAEVVNLPLNGKYISGLTVYDSANAPAWGIGDTNTGMKLFGDRDFTVSSYPEFLNGSEHIITAGNSKNFSGDEAKFSVKADATVYVALDNRVTAPSWLSSYTNTGSSFECNGEIFYIYSKDFASGEQVVLGANSTIYNCMNYSVFVKAKPQETTTTTAATTTTTETVTTASTSSDSEYVPGDANCDGSVTVADAVAILQFIGNRDKYELSPEGKRNADVDGVGGVTASDALFIQMVDAGLKTLPAVQRETTSSTTTTSATTTTVQTTTTSPYYFAVDQTWDDGWAESSNSGFTKTEAGMGTSGNIGYVNLNNVAGSYLTFSVNVPQSGNYMTHIRFANGSSIDRKTNVYVNGDTSSYWQQSFPSTGSWTEWNEYGIVLPLKAGANTIKFESAVSEGGPNFDYIDLTLTDEPVAELYDPNAGQQILDGSKPTVYLAGDSTCQYYNASKQSQNGGPIQGWGYYLSDYFSDDVTVSNQAIAGRSSKKFYDEGRFAYITENLKKGDFVMIQFAINDAGKSNADRYAPTCGNVDNPSSGSYEWYMTSFIKDTQAKGATPILMSCTLSAKSYSNGQFTASYTNYSDACKKLAAKYNVPYVDVNGIMVNHYNKVGYDTALSYHMAGAVQGSTDMTHFNENGAKIIAGLIANAVKTQGISGLSDYVK